MFFFHATILALPLLSCGDAYMQLKAKEPTWPPPGARIASDQSIGSFGPMYIQSYFERESVKPPSFIDRN